MTFFYLRSQMRKLLLNREILIIVIIVMVKQYFFFSFLLSFIFLNIFLLRFPLPPLKFFLTKKRFYSSFNPSKNWKWCLKNPARRNLWQNWNFSNDVVEELEKGFSFQDYSFFDFCHFPTQKTNNIVIFRLLQGLV